MESVINYNSLPEIRLYPRILFITTINLRITLLFTVNDALKINLRTSIMKWKRQNKEVKLLKIAKILLLIELKWATWSSFKILFEISRKIMQNN